MGLFRHHLGPTARIVGALSVHTHTYTKHVERTSDLDPVSRNNSLEPIGKQSDLVVFRVTFVRENTESPASVEYSELLQRLLQKPRTVVVYTTCVRSTFFLRIGNANSQSRRLLIFDGDIVRRIPPSQLWQFFLFDWHLLRVINEIFENGLDFFFFFGF